MSGLTPPYASFGNQDICVACLEFSAVIGNSFHRQHDTMGLRVVGTNLEQFRNGDSEGRDFDWSLLIWNCLNCSHKWSSYVFFSVVHDGRFADPVDNPAALLQRRSLEAQSAFKFADQGGIDGLGEAANPGLASQESAQGDGTSFWLPEHTQTTGGPWNPADSFAITTPALSDALFSESSFLESPQGTSWMSGPIHRTVSQPSSAPDSTYYQSQSDSDPGHRVRPGTQSPIISRAMRTRPSASVTRLSTYHSRGPNFDIDNYGEVRKRGACENCRARKKQCTPAHRT